MQNINAQVWHGHDSIQNINAHVRRGHIAGFEEPGYIGKKPDRRVQTETEMAMTYPKANY